MLYGPVLECLTTDKVMGLHPDCVETGLYVLMIHTKLCLINCIKVISDKTYFYIHVMC